MNSWVILIRYNNNRKELKFTKLKDVKMYYKALKKKYPSYTIDVISRNMAVPPKHKIKQGYTYCPYCMKDRIFIYKKERGYNICSICGISDADYYVKKYNRRWIK